MCNRVRHFAISEPGSGAEAVHLSYVHHIDGCRPPRRCSRCPLFTRILCDTGDAGGRLVLSYDELAQWPVARDRFVVLLLWEVEMS